MRWRITLRGEDVELRGYVDCSLPELELMSEQVKPLGLLIASQADDDYNPFGSGSMTRNEILERMGLLVAGRMALHWPFQCPMCPDRAHMALDIAESILADPILTPAHD